MTHRRVLSIVAATALAATAALLAPPAQAAAGDGIDLYFSSPFVQASDVTGADVSVENFNGFAAGVGTCLGALAVGTASSFCDVDANTAFAGASTETTTATVGGTSTPFFGNGFPARGSLTVTFPTPVKYVGFWWAAGNGGNFVKFYSGKKELLTWSTADVVDALGTGTGASFKDGNGASHPKGYYYGDPLGFTSTTPAGGSSINPNEPYVYLNLFTTGNLSLDKIELSGNGFEMDNLTTATKSHTPSGDLSFIKSIYRYSTVTFAGNGGTGTMKPTVNAGTNQLPKNTFTRSGYTFQGWATSKDGGAIYSDGASFDYASDVTLYAVWSKSESLGGGGSGSSSGGTTPGGKLPRTGDDGRGLLLLIAAAAVIGGVMLRARPRRGR